MKISYNKVLTMIAASLCYTTEDGTPIQTAAISLDGCFVLGAKMYEEIMQHIITKGGEVYTRNLGIMEDFNQMDYMAMIANIPPFTLIQADDSTYVSFDAVLKLWFTRVEVH